jgi:hypothetical protein
MIEDSQLFGWYVGKKFGYLAADWANFDADAKRLSVYFPTHALF